MAKMTQDTFSTLFNYGKRVYHGELELKEAARKACQQNSEIAESSSRHYILWYSKMRQGEHLTWNSNSDLLLYYAKRIIEEEGVEAGKKAILAAKGFAKHVSRTELEHDLDKLAADYGVELVAENNYKEFGEITAQGGEKEMSVKEKIAIIKQYIEAKGFNYEGSLIENFYLSLRAKPFVILAGTSGTGKTRLVRLFAEAIKAEYKLVSVRPDWSDSSDLFGHVDLNQKFVPGAIIDFVKRAELDPTKPYLLCLDEMNLARVEYYMSDILSAIETRRYRGNAIVSDPVVSTTSYGVDNDALKKYGEVILPGNLYIVGTVNMDETTFPFSKKVLDRANTIEFSYVNLELMPVEFFVDPQPVSATNDFLISRYITMKDAYIDEDKEYIDDICTKLSLINKILEKANAHIGYRVRDEIVFYMLNNHRTGKTDDERLIPDKVALDNQIMQKILPRIQGSSESIKTMLGELVVVCESSKYDSSAEKINFMIKRYEEDGFTSYWL